MRAILAIANAEVEDEAAVEQALEWYGKGMDFADSLHRASAGGAGKFATMDRALGPISRRLRIPGLLRL